MDTTLDLSQLMSRSLVRPDVLTHQRYPRPVPMLTAVLAYRPDLLKIVPTGAIVIWDRLTSLALSERPVALTTMGVLDIEHCGAAPARAARAVARDLTDLA